MLGPDYPTWALPDQGKPLPCVEYRPKDVGNIGGDVLKPILDALVWMELIKDDDYTHIPEVRLRIERVAEVADEGIYVEMQEVREVGDA